MKKIEKYPIHILAGLFLFMTLLTANSCNNRSNNSLTDTQKKDSLVDKATGLHFPIDFIKRDRPFSNCRIHLGVESYFSSDYDSSNVQGYRNKEYMLLVFNDTSSQLRHKIYIFPNNKSAQDKFTILLKDTLCSTGGFPAWFCGLYDSYVFLDIGTSASIRDVEVFDIKKKKVIYTDKTNGEPIEYDGTYLSYWTLSKKLRKKICPEQQTWEKENNGQTRVVEKIKINLLTLEKDTIHPCKCEYQQ